tara:strand:- start:34 stop:504 length:471 start_codon:yes stop_codon:yes gene_type:complete
MTSFYGVNNTKAYQNVPAEKIPAGEQAGRLRVAYDKISLSETIVGDVLHMMKIPKGARVLDVIVKFVDLDTGNTDARMDIGWAASSDAVESADDNGFFDALDISAAGCKGMVANAAHVPGHMKKFTAECEVQIIPGGGTSDVASGDIELMLIYVMD